MAVMVLDASVALAWVLEGEATADTEDLLERVGGGGALVPALWHLEVANALGVAELRERVTGPDVDEGIEMLGRLPIAVDSETADRAFGETRGLARYHGLSAYDASYLELASRTGLPLATLDNGLRRAAGAAGVETLPA